MKKPALLICCLLSSLCAFRAQAQIQIAATIGPQIPVGEFGEVFKPGIGFTATGRYLIKEKFAVGLNIGYSGFGVKDLDDYKASFVPVTVLAEYHLDLGKVKPYGGMEMGLYRYRVSYKSGSIKETSTETYFGIAPTIGATYKLTPKFALLANLKYHNIVGDEESSGAYVGLNFGAQYSIK